MILSLVLSRSSWHRIISERVQHTHHRSRHRPGMPDGLEGGMYAGNEHRSMLSILNTDFTLMRLG